MKSRTFLLFCLATVFMTAAGAADLKDAGAALFEEQRPFDMVVTADFKELLKRHTWEEARWHPAMVKVAGKNGESRSLPVRMRVRGGFRTRNDNCRFPQLFVDFSGADTVGTVFEGQDELPMTTHCRPSARYSRYVHREMVAYRIYNILSPKSLRVRTANVTYRRSDNSKVLTVRQAFFVEHFDDLADRLGAQRVNPEMFHPASGNSLEMGILELFEFMIGNTDWSAAFQHNTLLLQIPGEPIAVVPYDFDFSGLVNANYAVPASQFRTRSVRTRVYRGWCRGDTDLQRAIEHFQAKRAEILTMVEEISWVEEAVRADIRRYLDSFYSVLDSPAEVDREIRSECLSGTPVKPE